MAAREASAGLLPPPNVTDEKAFEALFKDAPLWLSQTRALVEALGLVGTVTRFATGSGPVLAVGDTHVVKWVSDLYASEVASEVAGLRGAFGQLDVSTPELVDVCRLGSWTALTMTRVAGKSWYDVKPPLAAQVEAARVVGGSLRRLHELPPIPCPRQVSWPEFVTERLANAQADQRRRGLAPHLLEEIPDLFSRTGIAEVVHDEVRLIHADLHHHHVLLDAAGQVTGWIDFADCFVGAPAYELIAPGVFLAQARPTVVRALLDGYGDPGLRAKSPSWWLAMTLLHRFAHLQYYCDNMLGGDETPENLTVVAERLWPL